MELFLLVLRNTLIVIAAIYVLVMIVSVSFVWSFASISNRHNRDITVILANKRDLLINLANVLSANGSKLDKKKVEALNNFDLKRIENHQTEEAKIAREELTSINDYLLNVFSNNEKANSLEESQKIYKNLDELDKVYRQHLLMYNADILGYNFWINFWPTRWAFKLIRLKKKSNI